MKIKIVLCSLLILLLALPLWALPPAKKSGGSYAATIDNTTAIDANRVYMFVTNHGNFGRDLSGVFGYDYGTWYPYNGNPDAIDQNINGSGDQSPNYASGIWVGGKVGTDTRVVISEYASEYVPGPMSGGTFQPDNANFRVYKLYKDSLKDNPNTDYEDYMSIAVPTQNAPVWATDQYKIDTTVTPWDSTLIAEAGEPQMFGDQMLWSVYNDADTNSHSEMLTDPLGIEVRQTVFAFNQTGPLGDIVFVRYRLFNRGSNTIDSCFISLWCDPDLGSAGDDLVGCDTTIDVGFVYNDNNNDTQYGSRPPSMGFDFFQGPLVPKTDSTQRDGRMWIFESGGDYSIGSYSDSTNLGMVSFNKYINGTDPDDFTEVYDYMKGLDGKSGDPYMYDGNILLYQNSGNPVTGEGDIDIAPADRRWMQTTGPITFAPGDSTEIYAGIVLGQGGDRKSSISVMKFNDITAQSAYDNSFKVPEPPAAPVVSASFLDEMISLRWAHESEDDPGDYPFQGYSVFQGKNVNGVIEWTRIANYDVVDGEAVIYEQVINSSTGALETIATKFGTDNGLKRYFFADEDFIDGGTLHNLSTYYYKVEAYSLAEDINTLPRTLTSSSPIITIFPAEENAGTHLQEVGGSDIEVTKTSGLSDGVVTVTIVDPKELTGHTYRVVFEDTVGIVVDTIVNPLDDTDTTLISTDVAWHLEDVTLGQRLLEWQTNQTGDYEYEYVDGFVVRVTGPPIPGVKSGFAGDPDEGWNIPSGTRRFTWANSDGLHFEGFEGALGWADPETVFDTKPHRVTAAELVNVNLVLAQVDTLGNFDTNDTNVSYAYRYLRGPGPPAQPEFGPYIITDTNGSYGLQEYAQTVPLSAWNMDTNPPTRLAIGYLENNAEFASLDGKYWPNNYLIYDDSAYAANGVTATSGNGPREWLWIYRTPYTGSTPSSDTVYLNPLNYPAPVMYWLTISRRGNVPFSPGGTGEDQFMIIPAKINAPADTFTFTPMAPTFSSSESELDKIKAVPNPFYLNGGFDPSPGQYQVKFHHLPDACTITIYNLAGEQINVIDKDDPSTPTASWDLLTSQGLPVASGIYIYVVDAPGFGQKIGKMAVFVEQEVLRIY